MLAVLMVDFSCALKLSMPIAVLSAMRECSSYHISVKGGKFLEAAATADTIVFDKTGTLTHANPTVVDIVTFGDHKEDDMLRLAACLEEHYPHSIANAVVAEAKRRGLSHEEYHSCVEYVVAHGISSKVNGEKVVIGSAQVGVDEFHAEVLPENKAGYIREAKKNGHVVMMIGDGVNDSPALSEADVGIAINSGAAIAKEIADVTISSESLYEIVMLRKLSSALIDRINGNYRFIVGFNLLLIALGISGFIMPTTSALLHNTSTLMIGLKSMTDLLPNNKEL
jgi:cation transport ATPase